MLNDDDGDMHVLLFICDIVKGRGMHFLWSCFDGRWIVDAFIWPGTEVAVPHFIMKEVAWCSQDTDWLCQACAWPSYATSFTVNYVIIMWKRPQFWGWKVLACPPSSLDLSLCDYFLFFWVKDPLWDASFSLQMLSTRLSQNYYAVWSQMIAMLWLIVSLMDWGSAVATLTDKGQMLCDL